MNKKPHGNSQRLIANRNAEKHWDDRRVMLSVRLPQALIERLRERGNVTAQIEEAIKKLLQAP
jgi:hypothetical protein